MRMRAIRRGDPRRDLAGLHFVESFAVVVSDNLYLVCFLIDPMKFCRLGINAKMRVNLPL